VDIAVGINTHDYSAHALIENALRSLQRAVTVAQPVKFQPFLEP
jgi:hypothetical protein